MDGPASRAASREHAYADSYNQYAIDAAFLWLLRSLRTEAPHYAPEEIAALEQRLAEQLDGLIASIDLGWRACEENLERFDDAGEVFAATVVAMHSRNLAAIQKAVEAGLDKAGKTRGLVSAFGWLPSAIALPWIERLLNGKEMRHKFLGIAACSVRRENPGEILAGILKREDCRAHSPLHARALRLIGELRRRDLMPALQATIEADDPTIAFWAAWSAILLGQRAYVKDLRPYILQSGPQQMRALQLAFRVLPVAQGREWISALAQDPANLRMVITATGVLGDPEAVNWLIAKMTEPALARLAGEAFTFITGVDLEKSNTTLAPPTQTPGTDGNAGDPYVGAEADEHLPWPDPEKVATLWRRHAANFKAGQRYFLGRPIAMDSLKSIVTSAYPRQRHAAALELALIDPSAPLINTRAKLIP